MKFVGGPMHGLDSPTDGLPATKITRMRGGVPCRQRILVTIQLVGQPNATYQHTFWYLGPHRELVECLAFVTLSEDEFIKLGREVFGAH